MNLNPIFKNLIFPACLFLTISHLRAWSAVSLENQSTEQVKLTFVTSNKHIDFNLPPKSRKIIKPGIKYPSLPDTVNISQLSNNDNVKTFLLIQIRDKSWISTECILESMPATWIQLEKQGANPKILSYSRGALNIRSSDALKGKVIITRNAQILVEMLNP